MAEHRHWKSDSNSKYLGAQDLLTLGGKDIVVKIKDAITEDVFNPNAKANEKKRVVYFDGDVKPMICNETNAERISKVAGSGFYDDWVGIKIQLYVETEPRSKTGFALRVREFAPREA